MLKFNSYRAQRYLRSKFVEGTFLLASEASDLELEVLTVLRNIVKNTIGNVALGDAWKVQKLSDTELLIKPGEMWFEGLPLSFRSGNDQLVSGTILSAGIVPVGVTISDDPTGLGKIIKFNDGTTTPTNNYKVVLAAKEELITDVDDAFLQNANLTETTAQKIRLVLQINVVPVSTQTETPVPYADEDYNSLVATNFPSTGGFAAPNLVNKVTVTPVAGGNGELVALNLITGAEQIDGRDLELVLTNVSAGGTLPDMTTSVGNPLPKSLNEQAAFANGSLIDSYGNKYHVNAIFNDVVNTQVVIRIDKEPGQPDPQIVNSLPFTIVKREVYVTDDVNGQPQGKLYVPLADVSWDSVGLLKHESDVTDLRVSVLKYSDYQIFMNNKDGLRLTDGGNISWDLATQMVAWSSGITIVNPHGPNNTIASATTPLVEGGTLAYDLDLVTGGAIQKGTLAVNITAFGAINTLAATSLTNVKIGNIIVDSAGAVGEIIAIDDVANLITTSPALTANGSATIYLDSFGPGTAPLSEKTYILAVRKNNKAFFGNDDTGLSDGESTQIGQGISNQNLIFIGATGDDDDSPLYSTNYYVANGDSLVTAIGKLDTASEGKADRDLGNLTAPTAINQDLNPDSYTDAAHRKIGEIRPFDTIRAGKFSQEKTVYNVTGTFTSGSDQITITGGTLPARQVSLYYGLNVPGYSDGYVVITNFNSPTVITMSNNAVGSGSVSFAIVANLLLLTDDTTIANEPSANILHQTGSTTSGPSGEHSFVTGDSSSGGATGGFYFKSGATSGTRGNFVVDTPLVAPEFDNTQNLGNAQKRWAHIYGSFVSATNSIGIRDTSGNPVFTAAVVDPYTGNPVSGTPYFGPFFASPTDGITYNAFGFRGRNFSGNTHNMVFYTGTSFGGNSGSFHFVAGTAAGIRGKFLIDALEVDVNNTKIINVQAPTTTHHAGNKAYIDACGGATTIPSAGGISTLTATSPRFMSVTGNLGQTIKLPSTANLQVGEIFGVNHNGIGGDITLQDSAGATLLIIPPDTVAFATVMDTGSEQWNTYFVAEGQAYLETRKTLGETLPALTPVYISEGSADGGRNAGEVYQLDETNDNRMEFVGFTTTGDTVGNVVKVQHSGVLEGFSGLTPGKPVYWYSGAISQVLPTTQNTWQITVGKALDSSTILINPDLASSAIYITDATDSETINNNQVVDLAVSGLLFDGSIHRSFVVEYYVYRTTSTVELAEAGTIRGVYKTITPGWQISVGGIAGNANINFNITTSGQITYTTSNEGGTGHSGVMKFNIVNQIGV